MLIYQFSCFNSIPHVSPLQGRLQLEADRHSQSVKNRDAQVRSLASTLELEGYERAPFSRHQIQSFHQQVEERLDQEAEVLRQQMVRQFMSLCVE